MLRVREVKSQSFRLSTLPLRKTKTRGERRVVRKSKRRDVERKPTFCVVLGRRGKSSSSKSSSSFPPLSDRDPPPPPPIIPRTRHATKLQSHLGLEQWCTARTLLLPAAREKETDETATDSKFEHSRVRSNGHPQKVQRSGALLSSGQHTPRGQGEV